MEGGLTPISLAISRAEAREGSSLSAVIFQD